MTIRRRLFFSNILMIVLPIILTLVMALSFVLLFFSLTNSPESVGREKLEFVYQNESKEILKSADYRELTDQVTFYESESEGYLLAFSEHIKLPDSFDFIMTIPAIAILLLVILVYLTNLILTRLIFKSIMSPINTLIEGVHEIRDGNLSYRIDYKNKDEFSSVCSEFNEMAAQLLEMVNQRQKDEQNRRELIAGISHDLRTPLTSIKSYVKGLQDGIAKSHGKEKEYLEVTYRKTCEMEHLIDQLLLSSKLETDNFPFHFKSTNIYQYLVGVLDALDYDLQDKELSISLNSECKDQKVLLDDQQMKRVISNIIDNSMKHNPAKQVQMTFTLYQDTDYVVIEARDNGKGVSEEQLAHLFDIFYRTDEARSNPSEGSGLGLSIAQKIVTAHGGEILAKNIEGLSIFIKLPLEKEEDL